MQWLGLRVGRPEFEYRKESIFLFIVGHTRTSPQYIRGSLLRGWAASRETNRLIRLL